VTPLGKVMAASTHHQDYQLFVAILRDARKRADVTQLDLATRIGNTQTFISKVERGERRLDVVELVEFCEALGLNPLDLLQDYLGRRAATGKHGKKAGLKGPTNRR